MSSPSCDHLLQLQNSELQIQCHLPAGHAGAHYWPLPDEERRATAKSGMRDVSRVHELKCWPEYYGAIANRSKPFELRFNDRDFRVGDSLRLRAWSPVSGRYLGDELMARVTYVLDANSTPASGALRTGWCVLGIRVETTTTRPDPE